MKKRLEAVIGKSEEGMTVREYLRSRFGLTDREIGRAKFREDGILRNGGKAYANVLLQEGDLLQVLLADGKEAGRRLKPSAGPLQILYEDEDLLAVDKPSGLPSHPSGIHVEDTAANRMAWHIARQTGEETVPVRLAGRLDKDTSGVLLAAKNRAAAAQLARQRKTGEYRKIYLALVWGHMGRTEGDICLPIEQIPDYPLMTRISGKGKYARTSWRVLKEEEETSLLACEIQTGRMHQIRIHLSAVGHPIVGDPLYGGLRRQEGRQDSGQRLCLHAWKLAFTHPFTREGMEVCAYRESLFRSS